MERPKDSYNYPAYPGRKEWEHLSTGQEMQEACRVPLDKLKNMSTQTDAGISLLERLKAVNPLVSGAKYEFDILELLTAQDVFISQLNETNQKTTIEYAINKDHLRREDTRFTNATERVITLCKRL
jgi:hypothetical protein